MSIFFILINIIFRPVWYYFLSVIIHISMVLHMLCFIAICSLEVFLVKFLSDIIWEVLGSHPNSPSNPGAEDSSISGGDDPSKPDGDDPSKPDGDDPSKPDGDDPSKPDGDDPSNSGNDPSKPDGEDSSNSGGEDSSNSGGEDSSNSNGDDPNDLPEKIDKGKGKATELPPDELALVKKLEESKKQAEEEYLELERKALEDQLKKNDEDSLELAKRQIMYDDFLKHKGGQSSKAPEGGYYRINQEQAKEFENYKKSGELAKQNTEFPQQEQNMDYGTAKLAEYHLTENIRKEHTRIFNEIMQKIEESGDSMGEKEKGDLLEQSLKVRSVVDDATKHARNLKEDLNIPSDTEMYDSEEFDSEENSGEEYSSDEKNSSQEESRPSKRPRK